MADSRAKWEDRENSTSDGKVLVGRNGQVAPDMSGGGYAGKASREANSKRVADTTEALRKKSLEDSGRQKAKFHKEDKQKRSSLFHTMFG